MAGGALKDRNAIGIDRRPAGAGVSGKSSFLNLLFFTFLMLASMAPALAAYDAGGDLLWTEPADSNLYLAGDSVRLKARAGADVAAAGGRVILEEKVEGDVLAAGGQVESADPSAMTSALRRARYVSAARSPTTRLRPVVTSGFSLRPGSGDAPGSLAVPSTSTDMSPESCGRRAGMSRSRASSRATHLSTPARSGSCLERVSGDVWIITRPERQRSRLARRSEARSSTIAASVRPCHLRCRHGCPRWGALWC